MTPATPATASRLQALQLQDFGLAVAGRVLLSGIDLHLPARGLTAVFGASGAGKSTFLRALAMLSPHTGVVTTQPGDDLLSRPEQYRARVQYLHQEPALFPGTVRENLALPGTLKINRGQTAGPETWAGHLEAFGLPGEILAQQTDELSGGEKQRLALVRALTLEPDFLLLDEPTSAMDVATESATLATLRHLSGRCGIIMVTHSVEAINNSDRVLLLAEGRLTEEAPPLDRETVRRLVGPGDSGHGSGNGASNRHGKDSTDGKGA